MPVFKVLDACAKLKAKVNHAIKKSYFGKKYIGESYFSDKTYRV